MRPILLACLLASPTASAADPDWGRDVPRLAVRLTFDPSPRLDEAFCRELRRELHSALAASFGLGIELVAADDPRATKTFSARVSAGRDGLSAEAASADKLTGHLSPPREARAGRRDELARGLAFWAARDLGTLARFDPPAGDAVRLKLQGGAGGDLAKKGDLFAAYVMLGQPDAKPDQPKRIDDVLFLATGDAKEGVLDCKVFRRYADAWPKRNVKGLVAVRLGAGTSPLKLKLVDETGRPYPPGRYRVQAGRDAYPDGPKGGVELTPGADGLLVSAPLPGVALLRVSEGDRTVARIPLALTEAAVVVRSLKSDRFAEERTRLERQRRGLAQQVTDSLLAQAAGVDQMLLLNGEGKVEEALAYAEKLQTRLRDEARSHLAAVAELGREARERLPKEGDTFAAALEAPVAELGRRVEAAETQVAQLRDAVARKNDPAVLAKQREAQRDITQAELQASNADFDAALASYDAALAKMDDGKPKDDLSAAVNKLRDGWRIKDDDHGEARQFFLTKFAKLTPSQLVGALPEARKHFAKLRAVGDRLTATRVLFEGLKLATAIESAAGSADASKPDDKLLIEGLEKALKELQTFLGEVRAWSEGAGKK